MAHNFGVQLKSKDGPGIGASAGVSRPGAGRRTDIQKKPVSDLKAMFDKNAGDTGGKVFEPGMNFAKKTVTTSSSTASKTTTSAGRTNVTKTKSETVTSNVKVSSKYSKSDKDVGLSLDDKNAFEALRQKLQKTGVESIDLSNDDPKPVVAKSKTFGGGQAYKASVDTKKVNSMNDDNGAKPEITKSNAASMLSFGLLKLKTRPGSIVGDENLSRGNSVDDDSVKMSPRSGSPRSGSPRGGSPKASSPVTKEFGKDKYIPGVAKGWKGNGDVTASSSVSKTAGKFNDSSVGKIRNEGSQAKDAKIPGFRSVSPDLLRRNSSDDSSNSSSNLSPRGYKAAAGIKTSYSASNLETQDKKNTQDNSNTKTDINKNIRKFETTSKTTETSVFKLKTTPSSTNKDNLSPAASKVVLERSDSKTKLSAVEQLNLDKEKLKSNRNSGSLSSDSEKGKRSPKVKGEFKWIDKSRLSLEEFKQQQKENGKGHKALSRTSSSGSNSSVTLRTENSGLKSRIERFGSPETSPRGRGETKISNKNLDTGHLRGKKMAVSRRMSADKFKDLKKGFESKNVDNRSQSPKPKIEIKSNKPLLERKQSFESTDILRKKSYQRKDIISPRDRGNVIETIKSLNELEEKAHASPQIVRRTKSLPSESLDDDSSECYYEDMPESPYYHDVMNRMGDDVSNEGDISSEADLIYEEIPSNMPGHDIASKKDFNTRRATAFRKRKGKEDQLSETQTGTEGDIDSDTDSSHSGIYEPIDGEDRISEADSVDPDLPPDLPPLRNQDKKKKKKKDDKGTGTKGFREKFKQLYKGKTVDTDGLSQPQSSGVLSSLGGKLKKNLKKSKSVGGGNSETNLEILDMEANPVCDSEGTDDTGDIDADRRSQRSSDGSINNDPSAPPLPPRLSGLQRGSVGDIMTKPPEPVLPSRPVSSSRIHNQLGTPSKVKDTNRHSNVTADQSGRTSPPLPPRNRISTNIDLNLVVPIAPGGGGPTSPGRNRNSGWPPSKDSYLHGQKINKPTSPDIPYIDLSPSSQGPGSEATSPTDAPPLPNRPAPKRALVQSDSYVDVGDGSFVPPPLPEKRGSKSSTSSYVDVGDAPLPDGDYSLAEEIRKELEKRPVSSAYIKAHDLSTIPAPITAPFQDVMKFRSEYDADGLYIDLSDDQVYGNLGERYKSKFESECLYQVYNKEKVIRASKRKAIYSSFDESDEEEGYSEDRSDVVYEDLSEYSSGRGSLDMDKKSEEDTSSTNSKISTLEMFGNQGTILRTLWAEMPEVKSSGVLDTISPSERKLQEAMFEIITSEATYLKSLNVLINVYLMSEEFGSDMSNKCVLTRNERHFVFSNYGTIRDTSERFLSDLESNWQKSVMLEDICVIIAEHASKYFECYVHYCSNQTFQDRTVTLLKKKPEFLEALKRLESHPDCQGLPMISFLLLPMQRVTRLPLLVDAICHRMDPFKDKERHKACINACNALSKVVRKCNDGAKKMQQTEQMCHIAQQIAFPTNKEIKQISLISSSRYLVKQGEVTRIISEAKGRLPFGKSGPGKQQIHLYLFNDIVLVTKKKGNQYIVIDYAQRNSLHVENIDNPDKHPKLLPLGVPSGCKNLFLIVILENHEKKQVESVYCCNSTSDRARWVDAVTPVKVADDQRIYEEWDCPQVQCIKKYVATEPDELSLEESDVVNVMKKIEDGMYEGERLRDGERGWFPSGHTMEIVNSHVRARNLRMKYRLLQASDSYS